MSVERVYLGWRDRDGTQVWYIAEGKFFRLPLRLDVCNHSPTGFEWGYLGSGPTQLSLALCLDVLARPEDALAVYQKVKGPLVCQLNQGMPWILSESLVKEILRPVLSEHVHAFPLGVWKRANSEPVQLPEELASDQEFVV